MRKQKIKKPAEKLKEKSAVSVDIKLVELFDKFLEDKDISNRSKYIENLIRADMESKGNDVEREF